MTDHIYVGNAETDARAKHSASPPIISRERNDRDRPHWSSTNAALPLPSPEAAGLLDDCTPDSNSASRQQKSPGELVGSVKHQFMQGVGVAVGVVQDEVTVGVGARGKAEQRPGGLVPGQVARADDLPARAINSDPALVGRERCRDE